VHAAPLTSVSWHARDNFLLFCTSRLWRAFSHHYHVSTSLLKHTRTYARGPTHVLMPSHLSQGEHNGFHCQASQGSHSKPLKGVQAKAHARMRLLTGTNMHSQPAQVRTFRVCVFVHTCHFFVCKFMPSTSWGVQLVSLHPLSFSFPATQTQA